jgi:hypothetical protein
MNLQFLTAPPLQQQRMRSHQSNLQHNLHPITQESTVLNSTPPLPKNKQLKIVYRLHLTAHALLPSTVSKIQCIKNQIFSLLSLTSKYFYFQVKDIPANKSRRLNPDAE